MAVSTQWIRSLLKAPLHKSLPAAPPVQVDGAIPTFALSIDRPSPMPDRLIRLALDAVRAVADREVDLSQLLQRQDVPDWINIWPGEHYLLLAALVKKLQPRVIIEIGTDTGLSALAMHQYLPQGGKLVTFDIVNWRNVEGAVLHNDDFADGTFEQQICDLSDPDQVEAHRALLESAEFFFVDAPKNGVFEFKLVENLKRLRFAQPPILLFDDTRLGSMLKFWHELPYPKLDLTSFGHWSGTGLVEWTTPD